MQLKNGHDPTAEGYYNLLIAIIKRAINDCLGVNHKYPAYVLSIEELESFLHNMFSDDNKVDAIIKRVQYLLDNGYTYLGEEDYYDKSTKKE